MFQQSLQLLRQLDAVLAHREGLVSIGSVHAAREELMSLASEATRSIALYGNAVVGHCAWELQGIQKAVGRTLERLDEITGEPRETLGRARTELDNLVQECERWVLRTQAEACTAAGPTSLPLVNMIFQAEERKDELSIRYHLYSALEQCETCLEGGPMTVAEREGWQVLQRAIRTLLDSDPRPSLSTLLEASRQIEVALAQGGEWTPWASLNRLLSIGMAAVFGVHGAEPYREERRLLTVELEAIRQSVLGETERLMPGPRMRELCGQLESGFEAIRALLVELDRAVHSGQHTAISACARRFRWTLTDLAVCQAELEVMPAQPDNAVLCMFCNEPNHPERHMCQRCSAVLPRRLAPAPRAAMNVVENNGRVTITRQTRPMTAKMEAVLQVFDAFLRGQVSPADFEQVLLAVQASLDDTLTQLPQQVHGLNVDMFQQGMEYMYHAISLWSVLLEGPDPQAAEEGREALYIGVQLLLESQMPPQPYIIMEAQPSGMAATPLR